MDLVIFGLIAGGAIVGGLVSLVPSKKLAIGLLCLVPIAIIVLIYFELADPTRQPDAQDGLLYIFGPLWPSAGALAGFVMGKWFRR